MTSNALLQLSPYTLFLIGLAIQIGGYARREARSHNVTSAALGSSLRRSFGSLVTIGWRLRLPHTTTWASAMSLVPLAARSTPTLVASGLSRATRSVVG